MRLRKPFTVFPVHQKSGKPVFHYKFFSPAEGRYYQRTTHLRSREKATAHCLALLAQGRLYEGTLLVATSGVTTTPIFGPAVTDRGSFETFGDFATGWWRPEHPYLVERQSSNRPLARNTIALHEMRLRTTILPTFRDVALANLSSEAIKKWLRQYQDHPRVGNTALSTLRTMLAWAVQKGQLQVSPALGVPSLKEDVADREIVEADQFVHLSAEKLWVRPDIRMAFILATWTGMRIGEIQGLRVEDVMSIRGQSYVNVSRSWDRQEEKSTKTNKPRIIPIDDSLASDLRGGRDIGWVFPGESIERPIGYSTLREHLRCALQLLGYDIAAQKKLGFNWHAVRHFVNSAVATAVHPTVQMGVLGHTTGEMSRHYLHLKVQQVQPFLTAMKAVLGGKSEANDA